MCSEDDCIFGYVFLCEEPSTFISSMSFFQKMLTHLLSIKIYSLTAVDSHFSYLMKKNYSQFAKLINSDKLSLSIYLQ